MKERRLRRADPAVEKDNVADQPGLTVVFAGILMALVLGLAIRGLTHPSKVQAMIESAARNIHPDVKVSFESAYLSLSDGWWPRVSVVVEKVRMESANKCWMSPKLYVNYIRLPFSWSAWIFTGALIKKIEAGDVEVRLTSKYEPDCDKKASPASEVAAAPPVNQVSLVKRAAPVAPSNSAGVIDAVSFDRLYIVGDADPVKGKTLDFYNFGINVKSQQPPAYQLTAQMRPFKNSSAAEAGSLSLRADYKEFPQKSLQLLVQGHLREGTYSLTADYDGAENRIKVNGEVQHLPLLPILEIARETVAAGPVTIEPRQSWMSFKLRSEAKADVFTRTPVEITEFNMEGDIGDIRAPKLFVEVDPHVSFIEGDFEIRALDLGHLVDFLKVKAPPYLANLGQFSGKARVQDGENFILDGEHRGLQLIFSNAGVRETQTISSFDCELRRTKGLWALNVTDPELAEGELRGQVRMTASSQFREVDLRAQMDRLVLQPRVQKVMTNGGQIAPIDAQLQASLVEGQLARLKGIMRLPRIDFGDGWLENVSLKFEDREGGIVLTPLIEQLNFHRDSAVFSPFRALPIGDWADANNRVAFQGITGQVAFRDSSQIHWTKFIAREAKNHGLVNSEGQWDATGRLSGQLSLRTPSAVSQWSIQGTRDNPAFAPRP